MRIDELALPKRARNALARAGIRTLDEAAQWSDRDLLSLPHIGHTSIASLRALARGPENPPR
jgi:DNA-directed RNA polymerase alpha subunit